MLHVSTHTHIYIYIAILFADKRGAHCHWKENQFITALDQWPKPWLLLLYTGLY